MSDLARSVFNQTQLPIDLNNQWWVECRLQEMKINGLVKMINGSRQQDLSYIDGYFFQYKWAHRPESINIESCKQLYFGVLQLFSMDFNWGLWSEIKGITDETLFVNSVLVALKYGAQVSYAISVYKSEIDQVKQKLEIIQQHKFVEKEKAIRNISSETKSQWSKIAEVL